MGVLGLEIPLILFGHSVFLRQSHYPGIEGELFQNGVHVAHGAGTKLVLEMVIVKASAAHQDLHPFFLQFDEILQHIGIFTRQFNSTVDKNDLGG